MWKDAICLSIKITIPFISLRDICLSRTDVTRSNSWCLFIWKGILHTCSQDLLLSKKNYIHPRVPGFYFLIILFLVLLHVFQSNARLACEGSFAHTCTNTFFKEYHNRYLKFVLKGFPSQGILHPTLFNEMLQNVTIRFYTSSIQGLFLKLTFFFQVPRHLLRHSMPKQCCVFLKECPTFFFVGNVLLSSMEQCQFEWNCID